MQEAVCVHTVVFVLFVAVQILEVDSGILCVFSDAVQRGVRDTWETKTGDHFVFILCYFVSVFIARIIIGVAP